jgi:hypothetical protein
LVFVVCKSYKFEEPESQQKQHTVYKLRHL